MATQAKKDLRTVIKTQLSNLSEENVSRQSRSAQHVLLSLPQYREARRIGIYLSMPTAEAQTEHLVRDALASGKAVFVPHIYAGKAGKVMEMLRLASVEEFESLGRDGWGIPKLGKEGIGERENAMGGVGSSVDMDGVEGRGEGGGLDVIVMPGVAFDRGMNRLGHGAGFYDGFLARFCGDGRRRKPFLVGLCLAEQVLPLGEQLATQEWDWKVDAVAVGDGTLLTSEGVA